jgi:hypothetical protein
MSVSPKFAIVGLTLLLLALVGTNGCKKNAVTAPDHQGQSSQAELAADSIFVPGGQIVTRGNVYDNGAARPESTLVGIISGDSAYLVYSGWTDTTVTLSQATSARAVACFVARDLVEPSAGSLNFQWTLVTGIGVDFVNGQDFLFTDFKGRWTAVKNAAGTTYLCPEKVDSVRALTWLADNGLVDANTTHQAVLSYLPPVETFGAVVRAWALPEWPTGLLVDSSNLVAAFDSNSVLLLRVNAIEYLELLYNALESVEGDIPASGEQCLGSIVNPVLQAFTNGAEALLFNSNTTTRSIFRNDIQSAMGQVTQCQGQLFSAPIRQTITEVIRNFQALTFVGRSGIGEWDVPTNQYYVPFDAPFVGFLGIWRGVLTHGTQTWTETFDIHGVGDHLGGTRRSEIPGSDNRKQTYVLWEISATVTDSLLTFQDQHLLSQNPTGGCQISGNLYYDEETDSLNGTWRGNIVCGSGTIRLHR